jgi:hypothetical protein
MTATASLNARQTRAGAPIASRAQIFFDAASLGDWDHTDVGVTTSSTTPTNESSFAHHDSADIGTAFWATLKESRQYDGSTQVLENMHLSGGTKALDSNYAAGRYLWVAAVKSDGSIICISPSYHIR